MPVQRPLTVRDTLDNPHFAQAYVAAGSSGLDREIRCVHILEISEADELLHGGEMILTTGIGCRGEAAERRRFLAALIRRGAACLCIELGAYMTCLPEEWILQAEDAGFPLIVFSGKARYVDITHDLHRLILGHRSGSPSQPPQARERPDKERLGWLLEAREYGPGSEAWRRDPLLQPFERLPCRTVLLQLGGATGRRRDTAALLSGNAACITEAACLLKRELERNGSHCLADGDGSIITIVIADASPAETCRRLLESALLKLAEWLPQAAGAGEALSGRQGAAESRRQAQLALDLAGAASRGRSPCLFYEELGVLQLLPALNDGNRLEDFVDRHLGPLLLADRLKGSELLLTLKVYLDAEGNKQEAARRLYIVRQSLYYRLERIGELLGALWLMPERRLAVQVALRAYMLLHPGSLREPEPQTPDARPSGDASSSASRSAASRKSKSSSVLDSGGASASTLL
ncbi:PucR C-terminal helix-turn-helix domain-containing protein [Paenibacillus sp. RU4T]|uniref:PucR family transcriptional regulator n=1 Tax=Paenibacillus sp. RU4T TaxID=1907394 RepID=UPI0009574CD1|nr:PucR C-terminal helix-turn-helix domain-containing protein [Paenibacillus sp. RU4X]SIQ53551.1 PucR C-terminal helix-turn-helix domain-containing protein [Paenibacillus sp. RU4T]